MDNKDRYSVFDKYLQRKLCCYAYSIAQANTLLRNQALAINGKWNFIQSEIKKG